MADKHVNALENRTKSLLRSKIKPKRNISQENKKLYFLSLLLVKVQKNQTRTNEIFWGQRLIIAGDRRRRREGAIFVYL